LWLAAAFSSSPSCTRSAATGSKEPSMIVDYGLAAAVTFGLLIYLVYALIRPEKF